MASAGIREFNDILVNEKLVDWKELKIKYSLKDSQKKTFYKISKVLENSEVRRACCSKYSCSFFLYWPNCSPMHLVK